MVKRKILRSVLILIFFFMSVFAYSYEPPEIEIFRKCYPDVKFECVYDNTVYDQLITITVGKRSEKLYWQGGRCLPKSELLNKKNFTPVLYEYSFEIPDPSTFSKKYVEELREMSSPENRQNGPGAPTFIYDIIYESDSRKNVEKHITRTTFFGKASYVHDRIVQPLKNVEKKIKALVGINKEVDDFVKNLDSAGSYNWRTIADSGRRSFHSMGVAVDILPIGWDKKNLYWAWRRDIDPDWMLLPLKKRWIVPDSVVKIFESEGFIYGGKWDLWDNMHFEYRPELILYTKKLQETRDTIKRLEEERMAAEKKRLEEEQKAAEKKRLEEELMAAEKKRLEEEQKAAEKKRLEEEQRAAEKKRLEEEQKAAEEELKEPESSEKENAKEIPGDVFWEKVEEEISDDGMPAVICDEGIVDDEKIIDVEPSEKIEQKKVPMDKSTDHGEKISGNESTESENQKENACDEVLEEIDGYEIIDGKYFEKIVEEELPEYLPYGVEYACP